MGKDNEIAVGIKLFIGKDIPRGKDPNEFERYVSCSISGIDLGLDIDTVLLCKFYDDMTGYIYFHFEDPINRAALEVFFEEEEIIDSLTIKEKKKCLVKELEIQ
tara:strand:+ start:605 stop:916 length:312 start_codon:yes stop_codon:yes gene_type:complete